MLRKIKSEYILRNLFEFIDDETYPLKLFVYSKLFQKKMEIDLFAYQKKYFNSKAEGNFIDYLFYHDDEQNEKYPKDFDKDLLCKQLKEDSIKYNFDINNFKNYIYNTLCRIYARDYKNINSSDDIPYFINAEEQYYLINIYSPIFEAISKSGMLEYCYLISINTKNIIKNNLINDYISVFDNLNKSNIKYGAIKFKYYEESDLNLLERLNIKFNQIKKLCIFDGSSDSTKLNFTNFYKNLFSFDIKNSLIYLKIWHSFQSFLSLEPEILNSINEFKSLKYLELSSILFEEIFTLKLADLKELFLYGIDNISFAQDIFLNLKKLVIINCNIIKQNFLIKLPEIKYFKCENDKIAFILFEYLPDYSPIFDFSSFNKNLEEFYLITSFDLNYNIFINICNCILNKPNLLIFHFNANVEGIEKNFYQNFIKKLLSMNLVELVIFVKFPNFFKEDEREIKTYSKQELKEIYPEVEIDENEEDNDSIRIQKII